MKKILLTTICTVLVTMLCIGLNAQRTLNPNAPAPVKQTVNTHDLALNYFKVVPPNTPAPKGMVNVTLEAHNVWGDGSGYQLLLDATATAYGPHFPSSGGPWCPCSCPATKYDWATHKLPANAAPSCTSHSTYVVDGSQTIQIPAGTYDYCVANLELGYAIWIAGGDNGSRDNYVFLDGKKYHFLAEMAGSNDRIVITITDDSTGDPCPAVTNVTATIVESNKVKVNWTAPSVTTDLTGYKVYQGGVEKATVPVGTTTWTSEALANGTYKFEVAATYSGTCVPVKVAAADVVINTCDKKVSNLNVAYATDCSKATITWDAPAKSRASMLFDNGSFVTHPGQGSGGADASALHSNETSFGMNVNYQAPGPNGPFWIAEDFVLTTNATIDYFEFFAYQTSAGANPSIDNVVLEILNGAPNAGGTPVWGDWTTNRFTSATFSNVFRVSSPLTATDRRVWTIKVNTTGLSLNAGTYWLRVGMVGNSSYTGPWVPPCTTPTGVIPGNALQYSVQNSGYAPLTTTDGAVQQSFPFKIYGEGGEAPATKYNVYRDDVKIAGPIEELTFEDKTFDETKPYKWSVAVICPSGSDGEWVGKDKEACETPPPPPPCKPVTGVKATFDDAKKEVLVEWTAPEGNVVPTKYEIYVGTDKFESTTLTYTHNVSALEPGDYEYEYCVLPIYATGACEGTVEKACKKESFTIVGIKGYTSTFSIVPNPANDYITITAKGDFNNIEVLSFLGQVVLTQTNVGNSATLDISNFTNGVYFVRITSETGTSVKKFVKQ